MWAGARSQGAETLNIHAVYGREERHRFIEIRNDVKYKIFVIIWKVLTFIHYLHYTTLHSTSD